MVSEKQPAVRKWERQDTVGLVMTVMGGIGGAVWGAAFGFDVAQILLLALLGLVVGTGVFVFTSLIHFLITYKESENQKTNARPEPTLTRDDMEWTRVGENEIRGQYRNFVIHLEMVSGTPLRKSYFRVWVWTSGKAVTVADYSDHSADAAIKKGLSFVQRQLADRRAADDIFDRLVGKASGPRAPQSPASTVNRDRRDFQRYMA